MSDEKFEEWQSRRAAEKAARDNTLDTSRERENKMIELGTLFPEQVKVWKDGEHWQLVMSQLTEAQVRKVADSLAGMKLR